MAPVSWSDDLPEDLLQMIMRQPTDVVNLYHYRDVCRSWRSVVDKLLQSSPPAPHLLVYEKRIDNTIERVRLLDIFTGESSICEIPEFKTGDGQPLLPTSVYSCHGWLLMDCTACMNHAHDICLYNPFSRARIQLPPFIFDHSLDTREIKLILSAKQTQPSSIALAIRQGQCLHEKFMFWKPGDEEWTPIDNSCKKRMWVGDIISFKGGFCAIDFYGNVTQFELSPVPRATKIPTRNKNGETLLFGYLVESLSGDLLMVRKALSFQVCKLDCERMEWDEITSLGDEAIFLARNESVCIRAGESTVYRPNCIYFTDDAVALDIFKDSRRKEKFGVYDMANKTLHRFPYYFPCHVSLRHRNALVAVTPSGFSKTNCILCI